MKCGSASGRPGTWRGAACLVLVPGFCLALCAAVPTTAQERRDAREATVYRRPLGNDPATLDPARIRDVYSLPVAQQIFDGLVSFDQTLTISPAIAEFWRASRDGLTWTFNIRKGVRFHHGREVTADDVVFSFTRIIDPRLDSGGADPFMTIRGAREYRGGKAGSVSGLVALDRYTVQITLSEAYIPFVSLLAVGHAKIVPRDVVEQQGQHFGVNPVGTGAFRFVRWDRGREIVLAANADYFDGAPRMSRVVYRVFPGEQSVAMYEEFQKGNLEDSQVPTPDHARIIAAPGHVYVKRPMFNLRHYGFNTRIPPLTDPRVRRAVSHAIDREAILQEVFLGRFTPARGVLPPGTLGYNPGVRGPTYDPARSRELLAQAGYPEGRGLPTLAFWSSVKSDRIVREHAQIKRNLAAAGIRSEFSYLLDWPAFSKLLTDGQLPVFLYAWFADVPDPDNFLHKLFHSKSPRNYTGYANPVVDDLLLNARHTPDAQRRVELYRRAEQLVLDDAAIVPFWHYNYERLFQSYVRSVEVNGLGDPYIPLRKIFLERAR